MEFDLGAFAVSCHVGDVPDFLDGCDRFYEFLIETNRTMNLTRITGKEEFRIKHVADSLAIAREFPEFATEKLIVADIGCGAGFPSLILALAFPQLRVTAIDSTGKKTMFVGRAAELLKLRNIEVVHGRGCELNRRREFRGRFDVVTARAVGSAPVVFLEVPDFVKRQTGRFIFYKTPNQAAEDLEALKITGRKYPSFEWRAGTEFELPCDAGRRVFVYSVRKEERKTSGGGEKSSDSGLQNPRR